MIASDEDKYHLAMLGPAVAVGDPDRQLRYCSSTFEEGYRAPTDATRLNVTPEMFYDYRGESNLRVEAH